MKAMLLKNRFKILVITLCTFCYACNNNSYKESLTTETVDISDDFQIAESDKTVNSYKIDQSNIPLDLKIIKSATARYKVKNVKEATSKIKAIAQKNGAYISDLRFQNDLYKKENRFTIKVPQKHFDTVMDSVNIIVDFVEYENITTKDVTEEYIDIETRLKTKIEVKTRYETILRTNAKTVEDILKTEDKLRIIQEEIEAAQGRLKYLTNKVAFSTIQIDLYESVDYKETPESYTKTFWNSAKEGLSNGWYFIESFIIILINIWPLLLIGIISFFIVKKRFKK
ncbi:DUF4349 domain-containing protein [Olleya sp. HaHaR_3_96]|uniref:DUF4349 domain-containing protein n=1 Tax=Olleya sp. HaHaR_3_96 TaxID=2745560 RepID=UPI001C4FF079|nr:DUF4349 domain-containing protein [Olleya sp. HaHaR_3_96]QXP60513.1 DUF4349 domain-containing protein [Olleya sp. HaHaR_3_96]